MNKRLMTARLLLAALALLLPAARAQAQGSRKDDIVFNAQGKPVAGAIVTVCTATATGIPCSPLATLYTDATLTVVAPNPLTTDGLGNYHFYAPPSRYLVQVSGSGLTTYTENDVILPNDPMAPSFSSITSTGNISALTLSLGGNLSVAGAASVTGTLSAGTLSVANFSPSSLTVTGNSTVAGPQPRVDVTAFGCRGDSATDNTACVQAAINQVCGPTLTNSGNSGGVLTFPPSPGNGFYAFSQIQTPTSAISQLDISACSGGITFQGLGSATGTGQAFSRGPMTRLRETNTGPNPALIPLVVQTPNVPYFTLKDIDIVGYNQAVQINANKTANFVCKNCALGNLNSNTGYPVAWQPNTPYTVGQLVSSGTVDAGGLAVGPISTCSRASNIVTCNISGQSPAIFPPGSSVSIFGCASAGNTVFNGIGYVITGSSASTVSYYQAQPADTCTSATGFAQLIGGNVHLMKATVAGTSGATRPVWNFGTGNTNADNTVTWTDLGPANLDNVPLAVYSSFWTWADILAIDPGVGQTVQLTNNGSQIACTRNSSNSVTCGTGTQSPVLAPGLWLEINGCTPSGAVPGSVFDGGPFQLTATSATSITYSQPAGAGADTCTGGGSTSLATEAMYAALFSDTISSNTVGGWRGDKVSTGGGGFMFDERLSSPVGSVGSFEWQTVSEETSNTPFITFLATGGTARTFTAMRFNNANHIDCQQNPGFPFISIPGGNGSGAMNLVDIDAFDAQSCGQFAVVTPGAGSIKFSKNEQDGNSARFNLDTSGNPLGYQISQNFHGWDFVTDLSDNSRLRTDFLTGLGLLSGAEGTALRFAKAGSPQACGAIDSSGHYFADCTNPGYTAVITQASPGSVDIQTAQAIAPLGLALTAVNSGGSFPPGGVITGLTDSGSGLVTVTLTAHGFTSGQMVQISAGSGSVGYNGNFVVTNTGANTFTYINDTRGLPSCAANCGTAAGVYYYVVNSCSVSNCAGNTQSAPSLEQSVAVMTPNNAVNVNFTAPAAGTNVQGYVVCRAIVSGGCISGGGKQTALAGATPTLPFLDTFVGGGGVNAAINQTLTSYLRLQGRKLGVNNLAPAAQVDVATQDANTVGFNLKAAAAPAANPWQVTDSTGVVKSAVDNNFNHIVAGHRNQLTANADTAGQISITAATSGSKAFGAAYGSAPVCVASPAANPGAITWWVTSAVGAVTINLSASATLTFNYVCMGNPN